MKKFFTLIIVFFTLNAQAFDVKNTQGLPSGHKSAFKAEVQKETEMLSGHKPVFKKVEKNNYSTF